MHEFAVNLDVIRSENVEDLETVLVDSIVFERELNPHVMKSVDRALGFLDVPGCLLFRYLHAEVRRIDGVIFEFRYHPVDQRGITHRAMGKFDKDLVGSVFCTEFDRGGNHPAVNRPYEIVAFRGRQKFRRQHGRSLRINHADEHVVHSYGVTAQSGNR